MFKTIFTVPFAIVVIVALVYAMPAITANAEQHSPPSMLSLASMSPTLDVAWPAPHEPFDLTLITPYETVGAPDDYD